LIIFSSEPKVQLIKTYAVGIVIIIMVPLNKVYVVTSYPKGTALVGDRRAGFINSVWDNHEKAQNERHRLISMDEEQLFTYEVEEWEVS
jgi:hypothetical protein